MSSAKVVLTVHYGFGDVDQELMDAVFEEAGHWGDFDVKVDSITKIGEYDVED